MVINVHVANTVEGGVASNSNDGVWRPVRFLTHDEALNEDEHKADKFVRTLRSLLNKLSPVNFCKIVSQIKSLISESTIDVDEAASLLVDKAINDSLYSKWYVQMLISMIDSDEECDETEESISARIQSSFVKKLFTIFDELKNHELTIENQKNFDKCIDVAKINKIEEQLYENHVKFQIKYTGSSRVIAESFVLGILPFDQFSQLHDKLLLSSEAMSLDCLCTMLNITGKTLEFYLDDNEINKYFQTIKEISERSELPLRIRILLMNLVDLKENLWIPRAMLKTKKSLDDIFDALSKLYGTSSNTPELFEDCDLECLADIKEAHYINRLFNKFTKSRRDLMDILNIFNEMAVAERSKLVRIIIAYVIRGDIYSEHCGELFSVLMHSKCVDISDIILGIKVVIYGYRKGSILADQQIWIRLHEILQPLFYDGFLEMDKLEKDDDVLKARKINQQKKKNKINPKVVESASPALSWRRGIPVGDRNDRKKRNVKYCEPKTESKSTESNATIDSNNGGENS